MEKQGTQVTLCVFVAMCSTVEPPPAGSMEQTNIKELDGVADKKEFSKWIEVEIKSPTFKWKGLLYQGVKTGLTATSKTFIVTYIKNLAENSSIEDYVFASSSSSWTWSTSKLLIETHTAPEQIGIFTVVGCLHPDVETLIGMAEKYEESVLFHNGASGLFVRREHYPQLNSYATGLDQECLFITGSI